MNKIFYLGALQFTRMFFNDGRSHSAIAKSDQGDYKTREILDLCKSEVEVIYLISLRLL